MIAVDETLQQRQITKVYVNQSRQLLSINTDFDRFPDDPLLPFHMMVKSFHAMVIIFQRFYCLSMQFKA